MHTVVFLVAVLVQGISNAIWYSYLFIYLNELNASMLLFGAAIAFNALTALPMYIISPKLIILFGGETQTMASSLFFWSVRLFCVALIVNPNLVLLIDILHGFSESLFKVTMLQHIKNTTDTRIYASFYGIVNALGFSLSLIIANFIGGPIYERYGGRTLFLGTATGCFICSITMAFYCIMVRKTQKEIE